MGYGVIVLILSTNRSNSGGRWSKPLIAVFETGLNTVRLILNRFETVRKAQGFFGEGNSLCLVT